MVVTVGGELVMNVANDGMAFALIDALALLSGLCATADWCVIV